MKDKVINMNQTYFWLIILYATFSQTTYSIVNGSWVFNLAVDLTPSIMVFIYIIAMLAYEKFYMKE